LLTVSAGYFFDFFSLGGLPSANRRTVAPGYPFQACHALRVARPTHNTHALRAFHFYPLPMPARSSSSPNIEHQKIEQSQLFWNDLRKFF
jgi:hypothetical protein